MAFKMKGSTLYGKLKLNRNMDDSSMPDGRAKSSAFQKLEGGGGLPKANKTFKQGFKPNKPKAKMLKGTTVFGKTIDEIKGKGKKAISNLPISKAIKKGKEIGKKFSNKKHMATGNPKVEHGKASMYQRSPLRDEGYKGKTKADVRASVLANNKGKSASDKSRKSMASEMKLWRIQNRKIERSAQTEAPKPQKREKEVKKAKGKDYKGWAVNIGNVTAGTGSRFEKAKGKSSALKTDKDEFPGLLPEVKVKMSDHQTKRDKLAKQARKGRSGSVKKGMEQSVRSQDYKDADKYLSSKGDKDAKQRLRDRKARVEKTRKAYTENPNMTQKERNKMMSGN